MALKKKIILENGIPMEYHRIAEIKNIVNYNTSLVVISYVNQEQRNREKEGKIKYSNDIYTTIFNEVMPYNDKLTIKEAYEYLKSTPKYEGAEDIFESEEEINEKSNSEMVQD